MTQTQARMLKVPFFPYPHVFGQHEAEIRAALLETASRGAFIMQEELIEFEKKLAAYCGARFAIGVGNATDALEMIVRASGIGPGDEVILPSHTFVASASAVVASGAHPVFAEIGSDHLVDSKDLPLRLTSRTRAVMPTQLNGRTADMDALAQFGKSNGLLILEDSAQGLGSLFRGRMAGTFGIAGVYSFYPAKTLGGLGDGGAIVTTDEELATTVMELRDHGRNPQTGELRRWGRNSRLDNLQAAVLLVKLRHFASEIESRRAVAAQYDSSLRHLDTLVLPPSPDENDAHFDTYQNYEMEADRRDELKEHLNRHGVGTLIQWGGKGVHQFESLGIDQKLPVTERMIGRSLLLPMNSSLTSEQVDYVSEKVHTFYA